MPVSKQVLSIDHRESRIEAPARPFGHTIAQHGGNGVIDPKDMSTGFLLGMGPSFCPDGYAMDLTAGGADRRRADLWWG